MSPRKIGRRGGTLAPTHIQIGFYSRTRPGPNFSQAGDPGRTGSRRGYRGARIIVVKEGQRAFESWIVEDDGRRVDHIDYDGEIRKHRK